MSEVKDERQDSLQRWWSKKASSHQVLFEDNGRVKTARFHDHLLIVDPKEQGLLAALQSGSVPDVYEIVGRPYKEGKERDAFIGFLYKFLAPEGEVLLSSLKAINSLLTTEDVQAEKLSSSSDARMLIGAIARRKSLKGMTF